MNAKRIITEKIIEMQYTGIWKKEFPEWVTVFERRKQEQSDDFGEWLQFIFIPNKLQELSSNYTSIEKIYIVPQAVKYYGNDSTKVNLLKLLIELDSLS